MVTVVARVEANILGQAVAEAMGATIPGNRVRPVLILIFWGLNFSAEAAEAAGMKPLMTLLH
jgi:hypothetical protein